MVTNWNNTFDRKGEFETYYPITYIKDGINANNIIDNSDCLFVNNKFKTSFKGVLLKVTKIINNRLYFKYRLDCEVQYDTKYDTSISGWYLLNKDVSHKLIIQPDIMEEDNYSATLDVIIGKVYDLIKDFRTDENDASVIITKERIIKWINQFDKDDHIFLLNELLEIFSKRYYSKASIEDLLVAMIESLCAKYEYSDKSAFLYDAVFLDLQSNGKSQKVLLKILGGILKNKYSFDINDCGKNGKKYFIYLDDILCTGNTLFQNIKDWSSEKYNTKFTNKEAIKNNLAKLVFVYIFNHIKNCNKKLNEFEIKIDETFSNNIDVMNRIYIQNLESDSKSALDIVLPLNNPKDKFVEEYRKSIVEQVNEYIDGKYSVNDEFYRPDGMPKSEILFTSKENRDRFENIILKKGIEILKKANISKINVRSLGFALPSHKNFGFGTLCFTWRNVPNNTPLVFWYKGGGFFPLFVKR